jgi:hypothetical protein
VEGEKRPQSGQLVSGTRINQGLPNVKKETPTLHCGKRWYGGKIESKLAPVSLHQANDCRPTGKGHEGLTIGIEDIGNNDA